MSDFEAELSTVLRRFLKKYLSKNNKLYILLILEIWALKWCNIYLTDIWFKRVMRDQNKYFDTNYRHFRDWKILSCHDLGYQMSIFKKNKKRYIKLKPLISSLLWNLHHENISFRSKVIPINFRKIPVPVLNPPVYSSIVIGTTYYC